MLHVIAFNSNDVTSKDYPEILNLVPAIFDLVGICSRCFSETTYMRIYIERRFSSRLYFYQFSELSGENFTETPTA